MSLNIESLQGKVLELVGLTPDIGRGKDVMELVGLAFTASKSPGVVYDRSPAAIFSVIGRMMLLFAEPDFVPEDGVILETVESLLMLLRSNLRKAFRMFFHDAMKAIEDLQPIASLHSSDPELREFRCFRMSFSGIWGDPCRLCDLPDTNKARDGDGLLLNLLGSKRWQSFATFIVKLIFRSLTEGTHDVEGLIHTAFVKASSSLVRCASETVQMACFELASLVGSVLRFSILPHVDLIQSIVYLLRADDAGLPVYRNAVFDSTIGRCLRTVYSSCSDIDVKLTAESLVSVFPRALRRTKSEELKASLCSAYVRIVKSCPPNMWKLHSLLELLHLPEPCFQLIECFKAVLGPDGRLTSAANDKTVGEKRHLKDESAYSRKRQKVTADSQQGAYFETDGQDLREMLNSLVKSLKPPPVGPRISLAALSILSNAFCLCSWTDIAHSLFHQMYAWIRWISEQVEKKDPTMLDISLYLEGIDNLLLLEPDLHDTTSKRDNLKAIQVLLKLPWTLPTLFEKPHSLLKSKCLSVGIWAKLRFHDESDFGIFDKALTDVCYILHDADSSGATQLACVEVIRRILGHVPPNILVKSRSQWISCIRDLLLHVNTDIREAFSAQIGIFVQDTILSCLFPHDEDAEKKSSGRRFFDLIEDSLGKTQDPLVLQTLLGSTAEVMVSVKSTSELFSLSLFLLIDQLDHDNLILRTYASRLINRSCYIHVKGGFGMLLSRAADIQNELFNHLSLKLTSRPAVVTEFAEAVLGVETKELVGKMVPVVLPKLLVDWTAENGHADGTLTQLAHLSEIDRVNLIKRWLAKILVFACKQERKENLLSVLRPMLTSDDRSMFADALPALLDELIVDDGVTNIWLTKEMKEISKVLTDTEELPEFLQSYFGGLLTSIDRKMLHAEDIFLQKQALRRIKLLIKMMGRYLSTHVSKLIVLLMYAIDKKALQSEGLSVLQFLTRMLAAESPSSVKYVIHPVFAALIPFLDRGKQCPPEVVEILEALVLNNAYIEKKHLCGIPLLPSIPSLANLNFAIAERRDSMSLKDQIHDIVNGMKHENLNVRYMVACQLRKLLYYGEQGLAALIAAELSDMDILSSLITSLLQGCAEPTVGQRLELVYADCLGEIGAIDPAKVRASSCNHVEILSSEDELIFELINKHLVRAFRAAQDTTVQDASAFAIQELLKIVGCTPSVAGIVVHNESNSSGSSGGRESGAKERGLKLWQRFSKDVKELIAPCLTSRLGCPETPDVPTDRPSMSFRSWQSDWIKKMTALRSFRQPIYVACRGIVYHDLSTATYLLPYIFRDLIGNCGMVEFLTEEILSVLDSAASENGLSEVCVQAVFKLLDNLGQWLNDVKQGIAGEDQVSTPPSSSSQSSDRLLSTGARRPRQHDLQIQRKYVMKFLLAIPKLKLAEASFKCQAYARSLMYLESHVREKPQSSNPAAGKTGGFENVDLLSFLMGIYSRLDEPDGISGVACLSKSLSLQDQLLIKAKSGNSEEVIYACEQALQMEPNSVERNSDFLNCLLNMGNHESVVAHVDGLISRVPEYKKTWCSKGVQAAWRLGNWDLMDKYLGGADEEALLNSSSDSNPSFDIDLAKILQAMRKEAYHIVYERIEMSKQALIAPLAAAGMDSYTRAYPFVVKLHLLSELHKFQAFLGTSSCFEKSFSTSDPEISEIVVDNWENRLRFTQPSLQTREPLLAFRRFVFGAYRHGARVGNCWLQYAKLCRLAGHYKTADRAILEAQLSGAPNVHMEKAKLLWITKDSNNAIKELQQSLLNMPKGVVYSAVISSINSFSVAPLNLEEISLTDDDFNDRKDVAKTLLLYFKWIHNRGEIPKKDVLNLYSQVVKALPPWDKGYFQLAKYYDELYVDARKCQQESSAGCNKGSLKSNSSTEKAWWDYLSKGMYFYGKGLRSGHKNLFEALPRLLTLWFDFASVYQMSGSAEKQKLESTHREINSLMRSCLKNLPTYQWLIVLPQLVSRICHQKEETKETVKDIITCVLLQFPQQGLWMMAGVSKSGDPARRKAATEIIQGAQSRSSNRRGNLFLQFASVIDDFSELCVLDGKGNPESINIAAEVKALKTMMPLDIIMPIQQSLTISLPAFHMKNSEGHPACVFGSDLPTILGIEEKAEILTSLRRPKKIFLLGSDGIAYPFLFKGGDDLRQDALMMEFSEMINRFLSKDPESRRRKLNICTFAVVPLKEKCGLVEWVPYTRGLSSILKELYISCGKFDPQKTRIKIKDIYDSWGSEKKSEMLETKILPMFPPVFHKWFLTTFPEPTAWFRSRVAYARTIAVWSMVGHMVGLADRHGGNILFGSTSGDCVHVDFGHLFDTDLLKETPESVPFRLTQNMIDGLGITGYEGIFRKVCEITLTVMKTHRQTLMSILEVIIDDPLVRWTNSATRAKQVISIIDARLQGLIDGAPVSVEGRVGRLISDATSLEKLGKMRVGWAPWW